jgi:hypothetical protein
LLRQKRLRHAQQLSAILLLSIRVVPKLCVRHSCLAVELKETFQVGLFLGLLTSSPLATSEELHPHDHSNFDGR